MHSKHLAVVEGEVVAVIVVGEAVDTVMVTVMVMAEEMDEVEVDVVQTSNM